MISFQRHNQVNVAGRAWPSIEDGVPDLRRGAEPHTTRFPNPRILGGCSILRLSLLFLVFLRTTDASGPRLHHTHTAFVRRVILVLASAVPADNWRRINRLSEKCLHDWAIQGRMTALVRHEVLRGSHGVLDDGELELRRIGARREREILHGYFA